jgi:serine/threonine-protein kinase
MGSAVAGQPQVGALIDRKYKIEKVLGEGGMGIVYLATDVNADQKVVIKSIRPEYVSRADFRERTLQEGKALAKIDHQNVVRFNAIINMPETNELYIVMQFIEGESLDKTLEKANAAGQKLPIGEVLRLFKMTLDGVAAAHREGLMHRDLKPANVLVRARDGVAKVTDFGIAKAEGAKGPTQAGGVVGSLWYMAPEQIKGARDLDKRLDVYAMGIVLYELTTGVVPFDGETEYEIMSKHLNEPVPSILRLRPDAPPWIDDLIARATAKDRNQRFQSCEEFRAAIDAYDGGQPVPRSPTGLDLAQHAYQAGVQGYGVPQTANYGPGGTASMMTPVGGTTAPGNPLGGASANVPYVVGNTGQQPAPPPSSNGGLIAAIAIGALILLGGGGAALYFLVIAPMGGGSSAHHNQAHDTTIAKESTESTTRTTKHRSTTEATTSTSASSTEATSNVSAIKILTGKWVDNFGKHYVAKIVDNEEIAFHVDEKEWPGRYKPDEDRYHLTYIKGDDKAAEYSLVVHARPDPAGMKFSADAFSSCYFTITMNPTTKDKLKATLEKGQIRLEIVTLGGINLTSNGHEIRSCSQPTEVKDITSLLKRDQQ